MLETMIDILFFVIISLIIETNFFQKLFKAIHSFFIKWKVSFYASIQLLRKRVKKKRKRGREEW